MAAETRQERRSGAQGARRMPETCPDTRAAQMTEAQLQKAIRDAASLLDWWCYHTTYSIGSDRGYPDLSLFHPDHGPLFLELKGPRGRVSDAQQAWIAAIREAGCRAYIVYPQDLDAVIRLLAGETQTLEGA